MDGEFVCDFGRAARGAIQDVEERGLNADAWGRRAPSTTSRIATRFPSPAEAREEKWAATRRGVVAGLPLAAVAAAGAVLWRTAARAEDGLPTGEAAALMAAEAVARSWSRPTGWVVALLQHLQRNQLRWLLVSYAGVHAARLGAEAGAAHMLGVGEVVSRRSSGFAVSASWNGGGREDFDPARFASVWRLARVAELERGGELLARLGVVGDAVATDEYNRWLRA